MAGNQGPKDGLSPELRKKLKDVESKVEGRTQIRRVKRLQELQDKLEESHKIEKLKNIEKKVFFPQIGVIITLFPVLLHLNGGSLAPFYLPFFYPLLMLFTWILILCIEAFAFRIAEIKHHPSKSVKTLMARNSMKKAVTVVVVAVLCVGVLYTPFLSQEINKRSSVEREIGLEGGREKKIDLGSKGRFDFRVIKNMTIEYTHQLTGLEEDLKIDFSLYQKDNQDPLVSGNLTFESQQSFFEDFPEHDYKELILSLNSTEDSSVRLLLDLEVERSRFYWLSFISFLYMAAFAEWIAVLYPIKKKYSGTGIYQ
ncbi:MAG: hypothetical protein V5A88_04315 [Candidatus Thermoplasmatota archaeon]